MEISDSTPYSTEIYTDRSKIGGKVGAGAAIYVEQVLKKQCKYKLQTAVQTIKPNSNFEVTGRTNIPFRSNIRTVAIYTDSKVTLASLRNNLIHSPLIEDKRNKV